MDLHVTIFTKDFLSASVILSKLRLVNKIRPISRWTSSDNNFSAAASVFTEENGAIIYWSSLNFINPVAKHSVNMQPRTWIALLFEVDNPGYWMFHCHLDFHNEIGMALVFRDGGPGMSNNKSEEDEWHRVVTPQVSSSRWCLPSKDPTTDVIIFYFLHLILGAISFTVSKCIELISSVVVCRYHWWKCDCHRCHISVVLHSLITSVSSSYHTA
jgi:hypothetical protein